MKLKLLLVAGVLFISACGTSNESSEATEEESSEPVEESRYSYTNSFEMADQANLAIVRNWNNALESSDVELAFTQAADSVYIARPDGTVYDLTRDSLQNVVSQMFTSFSNLRIDYIAGLSIYSSEYDHTWVLSYTDESWTGPDGDQRVIVHETYQIENGLIRAQYAYEQVPHEDNPVPTEDYGDEYMYSSSFVLGNQENVAVVEGFLDAIEAENIDALPNYLADSVTAYFADGRMDDGVSSDAVEDIRNFVQNVDMSFNHTAAIAVRSTEPDEEWVLVWFDETVSSEEGEETVSLHEAYLMVDGKIRMMRQWSKVPVPVDE